MFPLSGLAGDTRGDAGEQGQDASEPDEAGSQPRLQGLGMMGGGRRVGGAPGASIRLAPSHARVYHGVFVITSPLH